MTKNQRDAIAAPATGLFIYQTNSTPGFYYYDGAAWTAVSGKSANTSLSNLKLPTAVNQSLVANANNSFDLGSSPLGWRNLFLTGAVYFANVRGLYTVGTNAAIGLLSLNSNTTGTNNTACGYQALYSNNVGNNNTALGFGALNSTNANNNAAVGYNAGLLTTTGFSNSFFGSYAGYANTTGNRNVFIGDSSGYSNQTGNFNIGIGYQGLYANTSGSNNTAVGFGALDNGNTSDNTALGFDAGLYTTGNQNLFCGSGAGLTNTAGSGNSFLGYGAGYKNSMGNYNVFIGGNAGFFNATGSKDVYIGYNSGGVDGITNAVAIGYNAVAQQSNSLLLGGTGAYAVNVGIGTNTPAYALDVCGTIRSKEVLVQTGWCDYVFDRDYKLPSLSEVDNYIQLNKHLPDVPSAT